MESKQIVIALTALAHESRLDVFRLLVQAGPGGLAAGEIAKRLGLPATALSFHLNQLKQAGLITMRRESRSLIYSASYGVMGAVMAYLTQNCCAGACGGNEKGDRV